MDQRHIEAPLVLVVSDGEWAGRSLESVLQAREHIVLRSARGREGLAMLRQKPVDAVIVEEQLGDMSAMDFCRHFRREAKGQATPLIVIASQGISPQRRVEMYAAGAWDFCSQPLDVDVLLLKIATFINSRRALAQHAEPALVDQAFDLYTLHGFRRCSRELSARAVRGHEPLACLALATPPSDSTLADSHSSTTKDTTALERAARFVTRQRRESDVAAYVGSGTFAILAPATGPSGAEQFGERLKRAAREIGSRDGAHVEVQVGYSAVPDFATAKMNVEELLRRASTALGHLRRVGRTSAVLCFDDMVT
jgi:DNA-binding response OmpR family regulator